MLILRLSGITNTTTGYCKLPLFLQHDDFDRTLGVGKIDCVITQISNDHRSYLLLSKTTDHHPGAMVVASVEIRFRSQVQLAKDSVKINVVTRMVAPSSPLLRYWSTKFQ